MGVAAIALSIGACASEPAPPRAVIETASGRAIFRIEIADADEARSRGLMGRERLADDAGMAFLWSEDTSTAFHMKDTRIPLAVAFFDAEGRIVRILEMVPCLADPCPAYDPGVRYRGALEVNAGALERKGVRPGDRIRIER